MWPSSRRTICCPDDTHIARFPARRQSCVAGDFGRFPLLVGPSLSLLQFRRSRSPSNRQPLRFRANDMNRGGNYSLHARNGANIPASRYGLGDLERWNTRNWQTEAGINRSDTPLHSPCGIRWMRRGRSVGRRPGRKLPGKRLSLHGRSGRRCAVSRNQTNWFAAIAEAMTWLRVSSSGGIADAAGALVNAMAQRHGRGRRRSRNSLTTS